MRAKYPNLALQLHRLKLPNQRGGKKTGNGAETEPDVLQRQRTNVVRQATLHRKRTRLEQMRQTGRLKIITADKDQPARKETRDEALTIEISEARELRLGC